MSNYTIKCHTNMVIAISKTHKGGNTQKKNRIVGVNRPQINPG